MKELWDERFIFLIIYFIGVAMFLMGFVMGYKSGANAAIAKFRLYITGILKK